MEEPKKNVVVDIFGTEYVVRGEGDGSYIKEVAAYVDSKMRAISATTSNVSSLKVTILTALNLADEVFKLKSESVKKHKDDEKAEELIKLMENENL